MMAPHTMRVLISAVVGLTLAIPANTCIMIVNLQSLRKEGKLSPSDVIFMVKGMVNIPLQVLLCERGISYAFSSAVSSASSGRVFIMVMIHFLTYFRFWLTAWLSAHYCTNITNLNYRLFIWIKRIMSGFLNQVLFLTALGIFPVSVLSMWTLTEDCQIQHAQNITEASITVIYINYAYIIPVTFLGVILPFCLSLLCLLLTFSFLVRYILRVKNKDSGSSRPNLQAHVTALRTIFFLLFMFASFCMSQVIILSRNYQKYTITMDMFSWIFRLLSPLIEAAVIFQASNKLRRILPTGFLTRCWRNADT